MNIRGFQTLTLLDYPDKVAATIFVGGCNMRCPFCHNASLVLRPTECDKFEESDILAHLSRRAGVLDGVCITGGEPTLQADLADFISRVRELGYAVKLDTNGARPDVLSSLIDLGLLDYVAMDIKSSPENYARAVGIPDFDLSPVRASADILMRGTLSFEFRTTVVGGLHDDSDFISIGEWLRGDEAYFLQGFVDSGDLIGESLYTHSHDKMTKFEDILRQYIPKVQVRGI